MKHLKKLTSFLFEALKNAVPAIIFMAWLCLVIAVLVLYSGCSQFQAPKKNFTSIKWLPVYNSCFERLDKNEKKVTYCTNENSDLIGIELGAFIRELNFQNLLINKCKAWR